MADLTADQAKALGRRWMACSAFRWDPGMRDVAGWRVIYMNPDGYRHVARGPKTRWAAPVEARPPDLRDAATLGVLLAQAWALTRTSPDSMVVRCLNDAMHLLSSHGPSDARVVKALIAALEAHDAC